MLIDLTTNKEVEFYFRKVDRAEIKKNTYLPDNGWDFNWLHPISHEFEVFGLVTQSNHDFVEGLIALKQNHDPDFMCIDIDIVESSPINKKIIKGIPNLRRNYKGVGRCLIAFACQYSLDKGFDGFVGLTSKTSKFPFYESMGAIHTFGQQYMFNDIASQKLVKTYFPGGVLWSPKQI
ncbi:GNAT family N-acetyltransferase [Mesobacillus foraminis]|uniref:N-acetyltransferase domain-containing protein n=1 Tax=Mesobacillus foraminis TaxID=279826 RepID=A0A4R2B5W2_9BACI|nr:GNAT family N-acetyltransferase [Mesobacillus foraminis]TCN21202.1 hypothetical protein EV146_113126 [Mesobacillus foraminis]